MGDRSAPSLGAAVSLGQYLLAMGAAVTEDTTLYVRDFGGTVLARITKHPDRSITTTTTKEAVNHQ